MCYAVYVWSEYEQKFFYDSDFASRLDAESYARRTFTIYKIVRQ